jgi:hypothetical protein
MPHHKYSVAVDFDGVIHQYTTPWIAPDVIPDPPVLGAIEWLNEIRNDFTVIIHTTRAQHPEAIEAMGNWLHSHGLEPPTPIITNKKLPALIYIDDRGWRFEGTFPTRQEIHQSRPWYKKHPGS